MPYREYAPGDALKDYVQCYFICESEDAVVHDDHVFASGNVEIMFNLGSEAPQMIIDGKNSVQPAVQLWGQTIRPFSFTSVGKHSMLGIRFFGHTAAYFFDEPIGNFNDLLTDLRDVAGPQSRVLYDQLLDAPLPGKRIALVEHYLLALLHRSEAKLAKVALMGSLVKSLGRDDFFESINSIANYHGLSSRYLQTLFITYSGLGPKLYARIGRFRKSLDLVAAGQLSLTAIAYQCGYFDQSHFIKDFKYFTGSQPSRFYAESSTDLFVPLNN
ncbi:helix-turn-helix transcriptional regulator [Mucilaginibacter dorajii]|uniref:HTH araC/xylS-type domain-containing protein n=1 Tax=Mucilaginibacter dorajii TaxID=692994 RepID=A0ABP7P685_9SPHI|nr:helix-turn-helix transcriptional regulator [Mucilaginibacter dorajii]MCS3734548.1 AraC-like DNA-binding protein [Mucilaginibacter dorajii]